MNWLILWVIVAVWVISPRPRVIRLQPITLLVLINNAKPRVPDGRERPNQKASGYG